MLQPASRLNVIKTHFFSDLGKAIAGLQRRGIQVIRLDEGSPDLPPAPHIIQALERAARQPDAHGYQPQRGSQALREAWAQMYAREHGVQLDPESQVLPLLGSKEGIFHLPQAFLEAGDLVLAPDPGYVTYLRGAQLVGAEVYALPLSPEKNYFPDFDSIPPAVLKRSRLLWLNYPHNPTAAVTTRAHFEQALAFARQHDLLLAHDAAYTRITYDGYRAPSLLEVPGAADLAVEFNTLSKTYNMAGWRVGVIAGSPQVIETFYRLKTNLDSGHFYPVEQAAVAALTGDQSWVDERNRIYARRRDCLLEGLRALNFAPQTPRGSLYLWVPLPGGWNSAEFASHLLADTGVSLTPGTVFGQKGEGFVRISITAPLEQIQTALSRLEGWVKTWN